jgi:hypothetical protein
MEEGLAFATEEGVLVAEEEAGLGMTPGGQGSVLDPALLQAHKAGRAQPPCNSKVESWTPTSQGVLCIFC